MSISEGRRYYAADEWEHGLRCAACHRLFVEGDEIRERLDSMADYEGEAAFVVLLTCVVCDETGRDVDTPIPSLPEAAQ